MDKLQQIATEVGVSPNTVLRVLRGENKEVWPSAVSRGQRIRDLAERLGYLPNGSARSMRRGKFDCVALVLSANRGRSYLPDDLFNHIHDALASQKIRLTVSKLVDEELTDQNIVPAILRELSCDGLLINYTDHLPAELPTLIDRYRIPSVWINTRQPADCVYYDDFSGALTATERLLALGHRRIAYLDFVVHDGVDKVHYSRIDRYAGYRQAMQGAGLTPFSRDRFVGLRLDERLVATKALLESPDRPTAILSYDAGERILYAAAMAGLRVPQDLSVVTFNAKPEPAAVAGQGERSIGRQLTAAHIPTGLAGERAVAMLMDKIQDPATKLPPCVLPLEFFQGDTSGPAPQ